MEPKYPRQLRLVDVLPPGCLQMIPNQNSAEGTSFQTSRPPVIPIKNLAAVFTGNADGRHACDLVVS
jgi:hypothetical protein